jgi:hypothetical protein
VDSAQPHLERPSASAIQQARLARSLDRFRKSVQDQLHGRSALGQLRGTVLFALGEPGKGPPLRVNITIGARVEVSDSDRLLPGAPYVLVTAPVADWIAYLENPRGAIPPAARVEGDRRLLDQLDRISCGQNALSLRCQTHE